MAGISPDLKRIKMKAHLLYCAQSSITTLLDNKALSLDTIMHLKE